MTSDWVAVIHLVNGLNTDGAHHKQDDIELALKALVGLDEFDKLKKENQWEDGIPA